MIATSALDGLEQNADHRIGPPERRLFLMDADGLYWVRADLTSQEADMVADTLASWLFLARKGGLALGFPGHARLFDNGEKVQR